MLQIENTFFELGRTTSKNCLIICDRGAMDASACKYPPIQFQTLESVNVVKTSIFSYTKRQMGKNDASKWLEQCPTS